MNDANGYAVFFFPQALEALGDAIKPYLQGGKAGDHVLCMSNGGFGGIHASGSMSSTS